MSSVRMAMRGPPLVLDSADRQQCPSHCRFGREAAALHGKQHFGPRRYWTCLSLPAPPLRMSLPGPPLRVSLPASPRSLSLPPQIMSLPGEAGELVVVVEADDHVGSGRGRETPIGPIAPDDGCRLAPAGGWREDLDAREKATAHRAASNLVCPCTVSAATLPADEERCHLTLVYHLSNGEIEDVDVSGLSIALFVDAP